MWLGLIYLKLHLKNKTNRKELDRRIPSGMIGDDYEWDLLHHVLTLVRCFYILTMIEANVFGSMMVLSCRQKGSADQFDFGDLYFGQTMMLRLGSTAIFVVFNESRCTELLPGEQAGQDHRADQRIAGSRDHDRRPEHRRPSRSSPP